MVYSIVAFYFPYQLGEPEVRWRKFLVQAFLA